MTNLCTKIDSNFSYDGSFIEKLNFRKKSEITFEYISDFRSTKILRTFISELSQKLYIDKLWERRLILIVDELNNNAIEYWTKPWDYNRLTVYIDMVDNNLNLKIEVEDCWNWALPKTAKEMMQLREKKIKNGFNNNSIRWRWLFMIIDKLVDKLYFKDSPKWWLIVGIEKNLIIEAK